MCAMCICSYYICTTLSSCSAKTGIYHWLKSWKVAKQQNSRRKNAKLKFSETKVWKACYIYSCIPELRKKAMYVCSCKWDWSFTHHMNSGFWSWHFSEPIIHNIRFRIFPSDCCISQPASTRGIYIQEWNLIVIHSTRLYASVSNLLSSSIIAPHCSSVGERSPFSSTQAANFRCRSWLRLPVASRINFFCTVSHA